MTALGIDIGNIRILLFPGSDSHIVEPFDSNRLAGIRPDKDIIDISG